MGGALSAHRNGPRRRQRLGHSRLRLSRIGRTDVLGREPYPVDRVRSAAARDGYVRALVSPRLWRSGREIHRCVLPEYPVGRGELAPRTCGEGGRGTARPAARLISEESHANDLIGTHGPLFRRLDGLGGALEINVADWRRARYSENRATDRSQRKARPERG